MQFMFSQEMYFCTKEVIYSSGPYFRLVNLNDIFPFTGCHVGCLLTICIMLCLSRMLTLSPGIDPMPPSSILILGIPLKPELI